MAETMPAGLVDLEKELTCSICTEILYQPLTLLDCLHIFCGSCSKLWFAWQASHSGSSRGNPYTCPSCRATVRGTRPDAKITTLLDLFLQANPSKGKSPEEKADIKTKYTPGENVIPMPTASRRNDVDDADQRMIDEARALSLRELEVPRSRGYERGTRHAPRSRERQAQEGSVRQIPARNVEHQSSLRSLISNSEAESGGIEQEILRQVMEEGLLDGIDLHHMTSAQEDELTERIADAYRRRHGTRDRSPRETRGGSEQGRDRAASSSSQAPRNGSRQHSRSASASDQQPPSSSQQGAYPPVSRPHLLEAYPTSQSARRRTASESRGQPRRSTAPVSASPNTATQAARSATDLSTRARHTSEGEERQLLQVTSGSSSSSNNNRRATDPRGISPRAGGPGSVAVAAAATTAPPPTGRSQSDHIIHRPSVQISDRASEAPERVRQDSASAPEAVLPVQSPASTAPHDQAGLFSEPSISCDRCQRPNIQYSTHYFCQKCHNGRFALCRPCYIEGEGRGCLHWFGFGRLAQQKHQNAVQLSPATTSRDPPHALFGRVYQHPHPAAVPSVHATGSGQRGILTSDDPARRLRAGAFCYICGSFAAHFFWHCDACNHGEWGYCTSCVNQGRCCTHPLLPVAHALSSKNDLARQRTANIVDLSLPPTSSAPHVVHYFPPAAAAATATPAAVALGRYMPLELTVRCSVCHAAVAPELPRFHCGACDQGSYEVCEACYARLCDSGQISRANGPQGWRRCLLGHRMEVYLFRSTPEGWQRCVTRHIVGGLFLEDRHSGDHAESSQEVEWFEEDGERRSRVVSRPFSPVKNGASTQAGAGMPVQSYPPDGGVGLVVVARWAWWASDGAGDVLCFPRGAEIREVTELQRDWYVGAYAGAKGVFPAEYVRTIGAVNMS